MVLSNAEALRNAIPLCGERTWGCNFKCAICGETQIMSKIYERKRNIYTQN
jgi:hypothetical protein